MCQERTFSFVWAWYKLVGHFTMLAKCQERSMSQSWVFPLLQDTERDTFFNESVPLSGRAAFQGSCSSWIKDFYLVSQLFPLWPPFSQNMQGLFFTSWHPMPVSALLAFVLIDVHCILNPAGTWLRGRKSPDLVHLWLSDCGMMTSSAFNHIFCVFSFLSYPWREKA